MSTSAVASDTWVAGVGGAPGFAVQYFVAVRDDRFDVGYFERVNGRTIQQAECWLFDIYQESLPITSGSGGETNL